MYAPEQILIYLQGKILYPSSDASQQIQDLETMIVERRRRWTNDGPTLSVRRWKIVKNES